MAETRVPSVLWNVPQSLDKGKKETARTNIGVNGLIHGNPGAHEFVRTINEDSDGNLSVSCAVPTTADISGLATELSTLQSNIADHTHTVQFNSETPIDLTANNRDAISLNHGHGAITTAGKITENAVSVTAGMSLLIANSNQEIKNSSLTFGTDSTRYLNNKGEWGQPLFYRYSYTTTTETYHSQLSIRERPTSNSGLYLDDKFQGYLVPKEADGWVEGQVLNLYRGDQVAINKPIQWGNPYLTAYNNVESTQYTPTLHAGLHLGDGFGWGLSNTIETPYNGNTFPTNTALIMEGASITMGKIGIADTPNPYEAVSAYYNEKKITNSNYKNMLNGGVRTDVEKYGTSYVSIIWPNGNNQTIICRIPPHHWGIVSLCIHGELRDDATQEYHTATKTLQWGGNIVPEDTYISYTDDSLPYNSTVTRGSLRFNTAGSAWANTTVLLHNSSDEVKAFKMWCDSMTVSGCTYTTAIYKQILLFKTPEEEGAFNSPDETLFPPTN